MITANTFKKSLVTFGALVLGVIASSSANAQILLYVDISNPNAVTFTTTGVAAGSNVSGASSAAGIELLGFFSTDNGNDYIAPTTSTLAATNPEAPIFDDTAVDYDASANAQVGLDIFRDDNTGSLTFSTGQAAFTNSLTLNLNGRPLPAALTLGNPTSGNIMMGNGLTTGATIGQWEIVSAPEPSTWVMLASSLLLLPLVRRFRRA